MGANATVYEKPPTFDDGPEYFADYSNFKGATSDKTVFKRLDTPTKGTGRKKLFLQLPFPKCGSSAVKMEAISRH